MNEDPKVTGEPSPRVAENTAAATPVATTYTATDDEDDAGTGDVVLTLSGTDAASFSLTEGVLTFKALPNFEAPKDAGKDNAYNITVVATDSDGQTDEMDVTVTVTNVEEDGTVTLSTLQPRIGTALTATLTDIDGAVSDVKWQWARSDSNRATDDYTDIDGATASSYTPVMDDNERYLRATATYTDPEGSTDSEGSAKSAMSNPVEEGFEAVEIDDTNRAPEFPDQDLKMDGDQTDQEREIAENTLAAVDVGEEEPVEATDSNMDDLTYSLGGTDGASFSILRNTGQLQTKAALNREEKDTHMVTVTATDPSGLSATINVTINITDEDEPPVIMVGGLAISGKATVDYPDNGTGAVDTYRASGPDADMATWSLEGDDDDDFRISSRGVLTFVSSPDYENPADANMDNTYMVTVKADDGTYMAMRDVVVTVTDVVEMPTIIGGTLLERFDADVSGEIDKDEVTKVIRDYLFGDGVDPSKADVVAVIRLYLFP